MASYLFVIDFGWVNIVVIVLGTVQTSCVADGVLPIMNTHDNG